MKRLLSTILVAILIVAMHIPLSLIVVAETQAYQVPKAKAAPSLDGKIDAGEWAGALVVEMKKGDTNLYVAQGDLASFGGAVFQFMWSADGIYFSVTSLGNGTPANVPETDGGSYNAGNGIQFNIYPKRDISGALVEEMFFFSYHPKTSDGVPAVGEHFIYGTGSAGEDVPEAKIAVVMTGNDYAMEGLIPAAALSKSKTPISLVSGVKMFWNNVVMIDNGTQGLIVDNEWFDGAYCNEYTLVDTLAGGQTFPDSDASVSAEVPAGFVESPGGVVESPGLAEPPAPDLSDTTINTTDTTDITGSDTGFVTDPNADPNTTTDPNANANGLTSGLTSDADLYTAVNSAFVRIGVDANTELIDSAINQGPNAHPIEYVEGFGIGYTFIDDMVVFRDLNFGPNGAEQMTVYFGYQSDDPPSSLLKIYVDDYNLPEVAEIRCTSTGGYDESNQKDFVFNCIVPPGNHTIYVKYAEESSGSLYAITFKEATSSADPAASSGSSSDGSVNSIQSNLTNPNIVAYSPETSDNTLVYVTCAITSLLTIVALAVLSKSKDDEDTKKAYKKIST